MKHRINLSPEADYYGGSDAGPSANNDTAEAPQENQGEDMQESALIPKSLVPKDAKVGDVCSFKIVHLYSDEAEIQYDKSDKESEESDMQNPVDKMQGMKGMGMGEGE
jgi:hypothetical protein